MLQPANCSLESKNSRQDCNRFRQGVPLDNCKRYERIHMILYRRLQVPECHTMAVSRDTGIWFDIIWMRYCMYVFLNVFILLIFHRLWTERLVSNKRSVLVIVLCSKAEKYYCKIGIDADLPIAAVSCTNPKFQAYPKHWPTL